jgi:hypothetical protein
MKLTRTLKRCISFAMIGVLFFAQMTMAAYVCPVQTGALSMQAETLAAAGPDQHATDQMPAMADMPGCESMDKVTMDADSPSLCHASCNTAGQSNQTPTLKLPVAVLHSLPFVMSPTTPVTLPGRTVPASPTQSVVASTPLSVLYCCFRI